MRSTGIPGSSARGCIGLLLCCALFVLPASAKSSARRVAAQRHTTRHAAAKHAAAKHQAASACSTSKFAPLSKAEMRQHIKAVAPLDPPTSGKNLHMDGVVSLQVAFGPSGRVECVKVLRGQSDAAQAIAKSVKDWKFSPYRKAGKVRPAAGELAIKYHLRDQGSTAAVE